MINDGIMGMITRKAGTEVMEANDTFWRKSRGIGGGRVMGNWMIE